VDWLDEITAGLSARLQPTEDLREVIDDAETQERLERIGLPPFRPTFGPDLARFIEGEQKLWWPIVKAELK
jgi:hypothetical protein